MDIPLLTRRIVVSGVLVIVLLLVFAIAHGASDLSLKPEEIQIDLTKDIMVNPILENRNIWEINEVDMYAERHDLSKNEILANGNNTIELFIENAFKVTGTAVDVATSPLPSPTVRPENIHIDIKSTRENTLLKAAGIKIFVHKVQPGETLWDISRMYGIDLDTLVGANLDITNIEKLKVGQELRILNSKGLIHRVTQYETLSDISRIYGISTKTIMNFNDLKSSRLHVGDTLIIPGVSPSKLEFRSGFSNEFIWPLRGPLSSPFGIRWGKQHNGIDLAANRNTPVKAAKSGKVIFSGEASGYGKVVYIKHDDNTETRYAHNDKLLVKTGDFVYQGEVISRSGNTGTSTGPHLHFEIRLKGKPVNPLKYLN